MGLFKKKKTTQVVNQQLGDKQFKDLTAQGKDLDKDIGAVKKDTSAIKTGVNNANVYLKENKKNLSNLQKKQDTGISNIRKDISGLDNVVDKGFTNVLDGQTKLGTSIDQRLNQTDANINTGFNTLSGELDTAASGITNTVDQRANEINENLYAMDANNMANFEAIGQQNYDNTNLLLEGQDQGFTGLGDQLTDAETNLSNQLTDTSSNVLGGQADIIALIEKYGGDAQQYYADLSAGQSSILQGQGTMQTAFDDFRTDYDDYTSLANQARTDMVNTIAGGFDATNQNIASSASSTAQDIADVNRSVVNSAANVQSDVNNLARNNASDFGQIAASISDVGDLTQAGAEASARNFASVATSIAQGFNDTSAEGQAAKAEFLGTLNSVREFVADETSALSAEARQNYTNLANSFDENGQLIEQTVTETGNTITRALDDQGNLFLAEFNSQGERISQQTLDINSMMSDIQQATEQGMANIEQGVSEVGEGFATRFDEMSAQEREGRAEFLARLDQTEALLQTDLSQMDAGLVNRLSAMSDSFDESGQLIRESIDQNGNTLRRSIDENGNLVLSTFSAMNGTLLDQQELSINRLMNVVADSRVQVGSNANMQGMSTPANRPAPDPAYTGLATPYTQTV